ncbi:MAG: type 12 methyltransferase [Microgenomates group bacterium Gr01-1014_7]|nr:MAG: type 12 methyltransferase [Microgenomates group bacterium Gr01-1014_7]
MKNIAGAATLESMSQAAWYNQWTLDLFDNYLFGKILEVGCGIGNFTKTLTKYGEVVAIDIRDDYLKETKKLVGNIANVGFGDIEKGKYFFKDFDFDSIVCINVLEHIENDRKSLKNLCQFLKRGGHLILLVPAHKFLYGKIDESIGHYRRYEAEEIINKLIAAGFKIIKNRKINLLGALGWWFFSNVLKDNKVKKGNIALFNLIAPFYLPLENLFEPPLGTSILVIAQKP